MIIAWNYCMVKNMNIEKNTNVKNTKLFNMPNFFLGSQASEFQGRAEDFFAFYLG